MAQAFISNPSYKNRSLTLDFVANIQMVHKRNLSQGRIIDGKMAQLIEEGSKLLARAKAEVFHLLDNDSYPRFKAFFSANYD
mmetsp:Transcript_6115/g.8474  ORF Transcript_6115/g.8474 Transcript_6115/m.8474 type:complete len:82 (-) Transcript_6115:452-697(-)